ncbi:hypothetical protein GCM10010378_13920 [Streptomyces viridochromogenes]
MGERAVETMTASGITAPVEGRGARRLVAGAPAEGARTGGSGRAVREVTRPYPEGHGYRGVTLTAIV